ncbi:tripartite motif-containing protein 35-like [Salarias fasciatus]|uniref:tripartite motif-containing protein 35-like n=1 Tax=Salarias fasciatus TaxID=181472 RepID=UPI001176A703|nr:tripartite motif-containing protein 35-like [Salarias fasciatus]
MASVLSLPHEDLQCPVCREIFKDPVILKCSHSFCNSCVTQWWKTKRQRECPVCKAVSARSAPFRNLALKNLCDTFLLEMESGVICNQHHERLKLYCTDDRIPLCVVCSRTAQHRNHACVPVDEAADRRRCDLVRHLPALREKLEEFMTTKDSWEKADIRSQSQDTQEKIRREFDLLRDFLSQEEESRIAAVRREEALKLKEISELDREISLLESTISAIEEALKQDDPSFLLKVEELKEKAQRPLPEPKEAKHANMDVAKHLENVSFHVWSKMRRFADFYPVILNPNTAHQDLKLSEDLSSVWCGPRPPHPAPSGALEKKHHCVLGRVGFTSGTHRWDVEVGNNPVWALGVCTEDVQGSSNIQSGLWMLRLCKGRFTAYSLPDVVSVVPHRGPLPQRVRVKLNYDSGLLAFLDADDNTVIHTFRCTFTEKLFPYINTWEELPLKILPLRYSVKMSY